MKSINRLREWVNGLRGAWIDMKNNSLIFTTGDDAPPSMNSVNLREHLNGILDDIESEVADMMPLPVDADGVPIHVGDVMEWPDHSTAEVVGIGDGTFFYVEDGEDAAEWSCASDKIHHHAPTVEDVLREFSCVLMGKREFDGDVTEAVAEYAAKLRLAGEE